MSKNKNLTVADFIQAKANKKNKMMIEVAAMGGSIEAIRLPMKQVLTMLDGLDQASTVEQIGFSCKLIYQSCPIFRDAELQRAFDNPKNPEEVVMLALGEDLTAIGNISEQIMTFYNVVVGEELKN